MKRTPILWIEHTTGTPPCAIYATLQVSRRTPGVFSICTVTYGRGVRIGIIAIMRGHLLMGVSGSPAPLICDFSVVVRGIIEVKHAVLLTVIITFPLARMCTMASAWYLHQIGNIYLWDNSSQCSHTRHQLNNRFDLNQ